MEKLYTLSVPRLHWSSPQCQGSRPQKDNSIILLSGNGFLFTAPSLKVNIGFSLLSYGRTIGLKALFTHHEQPGETLGLQSIRIRIRRRMDEEASSSTEVLQPAALLH